jgi:uncharacterized repeat protein (TIGR01451 family)
VEWLEGRLAPSVTVTTTADGGPGSLRDAINQANAGTIADNTIVLPAGTYPITLANAGPGGEDDNVSGDFDLRHTVTLRGAGAAGTVIDGNGPAIRDRVFDVLGNVTVTFSNLTIRNGDTGGSGGGIRDLGGTVNLINCVVTSNQANEGQGGGIAVGSPTSAGAVLNLTNSTVSQNTAGAAAGGIAVFAGATAALTNSTVSGNGAAVKAGGIFNAGTLTVTGSTLSGNTAGGPGGGQDGGGLVNSGGTATLTNSTLSGNVTGGSGGGVFNPGGTVNLNFVTLTNNTAARTGFAGTPGHGGGVWTGTGATLNVRNSILAGNFDQGGAGAIPDVAGPSASGGNNLVGIRTGGTGFTPGAGGDQAGSASAPLDPRLGPLQDNGGPTFTHALLPGSPAIDAASPQGAPNTDQRGAPRPQDGTGIGTALPDVGAFEAPAASADLAVTNAAAAAATAPGPLTYTITVTNNGPGTARDVALTSTLPPGTTFASLAQTAGPAFACATPAAGAAGTVRCTAQALAAGASATFTLAAGVDAGTAGSTLRTTAVASCATADPNPVNNSATASTAVRAAPFAGSGVPVGGFEFTALSGVPVATFTRAGGLEPAAAFTATIHWGDGGRSPGTVTASGGNYTVLGSHTYTESGTFAVTVEVADDSGTATFGSTATAQEELLPDGTTGTADQRFVAEVFRDLLGRPVDAMGLSVWTVLLEVGATRAQVVQGVENTAEYREVQVRALFRQYLRRDADPLGLSFYSGMLAGGGAVEQVAAALVGSAEYAQGPGAGGVLSALYQDTLNRAVDPQGQAVFGGQLAQGASPAQVAAQLFASGEFKQGLVQSFYQRLLGRAADPGGLSYWAGQLQAAVTDEQVIAGIAGTPEYAGKLGA